MLFVCLCDRCCMFASVTDAVCLPLCQMLGPESEWHHKRQMALRQRVKETKDLTVRTYKVVDEVCSYIKKVGILKLLCSNVI